MNSIPKIIHYCWFGPSKITDEAKRNIMNWHEKCPNFEFKFWNESNFDINQNEYTKSAYENKEWAFISDYARLAILYEYGGVYIDVDVELLKPLNSLLDNEMFTGLENTDAINTGLMVGAVPKNDTVLSLMKLYQDRGTNKIDNRFDETTCVEITTDYFYKLGFQYKNKNQKVNNCMIYSTEYFCPQLLGSRKVKITDNTFSIHHYSASWHKEKGIKRKVAIRMLFYKAFIRIKLRQIFGQKITEKIRQVYRKVK